MIYYSSFLGNPLETRVRALGVFCVGFFTVFLRYSRHIIFYLTMKWSTKSLSRIFSMLRNLQLEPPKEKVGALYIEPRSPYKMFVLLQVNWNWNETFSHTEQYLVCNDFIFNNILKLLNDGIEFNQLHLEFSFEFLVNTYPLATPPPFFGDLLNLFIPRIESMPPWNETLIDSLNFWIDEKFWWSIQKNYISIHTYV